MDIEKTHISNTAIVISSCDKYSDIWPAFTHLFFKFWEQCPFSIYLASNFKNWKSQSISTFPVGEDVSWGKNLFVLLDKIDEEFIILFLDDFLINQPVDTHEVIQMVHFAQNENLDCLRLRPSPKPSKQIDGLINIGEILPGEAYRVSTQVSIWKKSFLMDICSQYNTPWEFEILGTKHVDRINSRIFGVYDWVIHYQHCVERGMWLESGIKLLEMNGYSPDLNMRPILLEMFRKKPFPKRILLKMYAHLPSKIKRKIRLGLFFKWKEVIRK